MTDKKKTAVPIPTSPTKPGYTTESLRARGFLTPPSTGQGFGLPLHGPQPKSPTPTTSPATLTRADLERMGFKRAKPSGKGYGLPAAPPPKKSGA